LALFALASAANAKSGPPPKLAPTVTTGATTDITTSAATTAGTVNPNGKPTTYYFQYGTSTSYGSTSPSASAGSGSSDVNVTATLSGLATSTTYHYQLVAINGFGTSYGADATFTTSAAIDSGHNVLWGYSAMGTQFSSGGQQPPWDMNSITNFENTDAGGKGVSVAGWGEPFHSTAWCGGYCAFQTSLYTSERSAGIIPFLSWSSNDSDYTGSGPAPGYSDADIASGSQDAYIKAWAQKAKAWGYPFFLRFDWEMNGNWFPWNADGTNSPTDFVAMWRHVHRIFEQQGATNVTWVWCPNIDPNSNWAPLNQLYPGDSYVDWTCLDGYNDNSPWTSFSGLVSSTYSAIVNLAPSKPMMAGEAGSTESGGSKAQWITDLFSVVQSQLPDLDAILWYENNTSGPGGYTDWPIESSNSSIAAFTTAIADPSYQGSTYSNLNTSPIPPP
jgi:hypothetical protein